RRSGSRQAGRGLFRWQRSKKPGLRHPDFQSRIVVVRNTDPIPSIEGDQVVVNCIADGIRINEHAIQSIPQRTRAVGVGPNEITSNGDSRSAGYDSAIKLFANADADAVIPVA